MGSIPLFGISLVAMGGASLLWVFLSIVAEYTDAKKCGIAVGVCFLVVIISLSTFPREEFEEFWEYIYNPAKSFQTRAIEHRVPKGFGNFMDIKFESKRYINPAIMFAISFWGTITCCPISLFLLRIREGRPNRDFEFGRWWRKNVWGKTLKDEI